MSSEIVDMIKREIEEGEKNLKSVEFMIKVLERSGEDTTSLKVQLTQTKTRLERLKIALNEAMRG